MIHMYLLVRPQGDRYFRERYQLSCFAVLISNPVFSKYKYNIFGHVNRNIAMFNTQYLYNLQVLLYNNDSAKLAMFGTGFILHRYITYIYFQITITLVPSTLATSSSYIGTTTIFRGTISPPILMKYYISLYKGRIVMILHTSREKWGRDRYLILNYVNIFCSQDASLLQLNFVQDLNYIA